MVLCIMVMLLMPFHGKESITYEQLQAKITPYISDIYTKQEDIDLRKNYGLSQGQYQNYLYYLNEDAMDVDELCIIQIEDEVLRKQTLANMQARLQSKIQIFQGYGEIQIAKLKQAIVKEMDDFCIYIVCEESDQIKLEVTP